MAGLSSAAQHGIPDDITVCCAAARIPERVQTMRTRKRCLKASQGTVSAPTTGGPNAGSKRARLSEPCCSRLRDAGFGYSAAVLQPFRDTSLTLEVAADALLGQLTRCSKQPEQERCAGFTAFPHKQRLEHDAKSSVTSKLSTLQRITAEVSMLVKM